MLDSLLTTVLDTLDTLDLLFTVGFVKKKNEYKYLHMADRRNAFNTGKSLLFQVPRKKAIF